MNLTTKKIRIVDGTPIQETKVTKIITKEC